MVYLLAIIVLVGVVALVGLGLWNLATARLDKNRTARVESDRTLRKAESALRAIANGTSGNPVLEAQIALDEITTHFEKELTS